MNATPTLDATCRSVCPDLSHFSLSHRLALGILLAALVPVTVCCNWILLMGLIRIKSNGSKMLVVFLCLNDLLIGVILVPLCSAYVMSPTVQASCMAKFAVQFFTYALLSVDFAVVLAIGIERLIVLKYPMQNMFYRWQQSRKYVLLFIVLSALLLSSSTVVVALYSNGFYIFSFILSAGLVVLSIILVSSYYAVYRHVNNSVKKLYSGQNNRIQSRSRQLRHDMALSKSIVVILSVQLSTWTPYFIIVLFWNWQKLKGGTSTQLYDTIITWSFLLLYINASANAFVYSFYNRPLRQHLVARYSCLLRCMTYGNPVSEVSMETGSRNEDHNKAAELRGSDQAQRSGIALVRIVRS